MLKKTVIIADDEPNILNQLIDLVPDFLEERHQVECSVIPCKNSDELKETLRKCAAEGTEISAVITDDSLEELGVSIGAEIIRDMRKGVYGDVLKNVPAAVMSGGNEPVFSTNDVVVIDKLGKRVKGGYQDYSKQIIGFIVNPSDYLPAPLLNVDTQQKARNHNAQMLINFLKDGNTTETAAMLWENNTLSRADRAKAAKFRIGELRSYNNNAFTAGAPDKTYLEQLAEILKRGDVYIEDDTLHNQLALVRGEIMQNTYQALSTIKR